MQYVMLPNTNLSVSRLALGGWTVFGYPETLDILNEAQRTEIGALMRNGPAA